MQSKVILITGASSGIGRAAAVAFARAGCHVAGTARRADRLEALRQEVDTLPQPHGQFLPLPADVTQAADMQQAVEQAVAVFGRLDVLVANAGIGHRGAVADAEWEHLETLMRTNIDGVLHSVRAAVPAMRRTGGGQIITISSVVFNLVSPYAACYAASKAFVSSLANSLRLELEAENIRVTDVLVGRTHTEFNEKRLGEGKRTGQGIPTMQPERVADALVRATQRPVNTVYVRPFDRLVVLGSRLIPGIIGRLARRQYK